MRGKEAVRSRRRIVGGLSVRTDGDEVRVTTLKTGLRTLLALVFCGLAALAWYLWEEDVFQDADLFALLVFAGLVFVPLAIIGAVYALPGERFVASKSAGRVKMQSLWLFLPIRTRHIEIANCHRVCLTELHTQEKVEEETSSLGKVAAVASLLTSFSGAFGGIVALVMGLFGGRDTQTVLLPVYGLEIVLRDGSSVTGLLTRNAEHIERTLHAIWEVFPQLERQPPGVEAEKDLEVGARVKVSLDADWARGAAGTVAEPPPVIANYGGAWDGHRRLADMRTFYWIEFDEPQGRPGRERPTPVGEIDSRYLEPT